MRKAVLQNRMALDILTAALGGTCTIVHTECCVYIADNTENVSQALSALAGEIDGIQHLIEDPLQERWAQLSSPWRRALALLVRRASLLVAFCCFHVAVAASGCRALPC